MLRQTITVGAATVLSLSVWLAPVQAAVFPTVQPYISNLKIGFTNGNTLVTQPDYDQFSKEKEVIVVTKAGKQGLLDAKSGKEIIAAVWDEVEVPDGKNVAIVRKDGKVRYFLIKQKVWSNHTFQQSLTFYLSEQRPSVIAFTGDVSTLLDVDGNVLLAPFRGNISFVDWRNEPTPDQTESESTRYVVYQTDKLLALLDPLNLKPLFQVPGVRTNQNFNQIEYLEVTANGKSGLVGRDGTVVLQPKYQYMENVGNGFVRIVSDKGVGLFKNGKIVAEPVHAEAGAFHDWEDGFYTVQGDTVTYHSLSSGTSFALNKGAEYLGSGFVVGQDPATGKYGVKRLNGETAVPFIYSALEGPPAARTLVRSDGKKGFLELRDGTYTEPQFWFDSYTTLGSYSMLSIRDGNKYGLYSSDEGLLIPPRKDISFRVSDLGTVLVKDETGKEREYTGDNFKDVSEPVVRQLTEHLSESYVKGEGYTLYNSKEMKPIAGPFQIVYPEGDGQFVVAINEDRADLFTASGEKMTGEVKLSVDDSGYGPPVTMISAGTDYYALGTKQGTDGQALVHIAEGKVNILTDFVYNGIANRGVNANRMLLMLSKPDGATELRMMAGKETIATLDGVQELVNLETLPVMFVKKNGGWDAYDTALRPLTQKRYQSLNMITNVYDNHSLIIYQDAKTGLYGILNRDMSEQTPAKYELIRPVHEVFPQYYQEQGWPVSFVFSAGKQFGYLNGAGQEVFQTSLFTSKPNITHRPLTANGFPGFTRQLAVDASQLVDYAKPYRKSGRNSQLAFLSNLSLYFDLPQESDKQEVFAALVAKGIIPAKEKRTDFSHTDFFSLAYYMYHGKPNTSLGDQQLWDWAVQKGLYVEHGPREHIDLYQDFNETFMNKLLLFKAAGVQAKAKPLSLSTLTDDQRRMLLSQVLVNGMEYENLLFPLPKEWVDQTLQQLIKEYNQNAQNLLQAAMQ